MRRLPAPVAAVVLAACATAGGGTADEPVILSGPYRVIPAASLSGFLPLKLANLARLDPRRPLAGDNANQTLSMFGREDLIAATSDDYRSTSCRPVMSGTAAIAEIERRARQTSIVIVTESHERSEHRGFIAEVARGLRPLGYDTVAMEALQNDRPDTPARYLSPFVRQPDLPYLEDEDGFYLSEAGFGRLGREVKALGYRLVPYEFRDEGGVTQDAPVSRQIAVREEAQANSLATFVRDHPRAKLLIHVGYHHATEVPQADGTKWMAARLREKTGIDPLTISQTVCRGGGDTMRLAALPPDEPAGAFDLVVDHPAARFERGRPAWRRRAGDRPVGIPRRLRPTAGWRVIEARPPGEPEASVPIDRVAIRPGEDIALMLPPGRYRLRAIDVTRTDPAGGKPAR